MISISKRIIGLAGHFILYITSPMSNFLLVYLASPFSLLIGAFKAFLLHPFMEISTYSAQA